MPTGYTADVGDGKVTDFRAFALGCARAFGACIMQRDDPINEPPKHRQPSTWNAEQLVEAQKEADRLSTITLAMAEAESAKEYEECLRFYEESRKRSAEINARYEAMIAKVKAYTPPTPDHEGYKKFMLEQLTISLESDFGPPVKLSALDWLSTARERAARSILYHTKANAEELKRFEDSNKWIDALYASLAEDVAIT